MQFGAAISRVAAAHERIPSRREELEQEILLAIWQALPRYRAESSVKTFVLRIAHHRSVDHVLRARREADRDELPEGLHDQRPTPEEQVSLAQRAQRLLQLVQTLPLGQRELVALALEGCSHQEIADIIGISLNNVAVRLSRARQFIQQNLER